MTRVTITVRIARKVEMRPKAKARLSLWETDIPELEFTLHNLGVDVRIFLDGILYWFV